MLFSLSAAAKAVGKGKSTLHNAIRAGRLSATRNADGTYSIDGSELARVYDLNVQNVSDSPSLDAGEPPSEPQGTELAVLRTQVTALETALDREKEAVAREREDRERERETARETTDDLRKRLDRAEERVLALTAQPAPPPTQAAPELPAMVEELHRRLDESEAHVRAMVMAPPAPQAAQDRPNEPPAGTTAGPLRAFLGRLLGLGRGTPP